MVRVNLRWLVVGVLIVSMPALIAEDASLLLARLQAAGVQNSLDSPGIKPWHIKVTFQLFDDRQKPAEQGTMEEWWAAPDVYKISFTSPSYTSTEVRNKDKHYFASDKGSQPYMLGVLHTMVVHPMPSDKEIAASNVKSESRKLGDVKLDCILLKPQDNKARAMLPVDVVPTYCFDSGKNSLRVYTLIGYLEVAHNRLGTFQQRSVALDLFVEDAGPNVMVAHITDLSTFEPAPADFAIPAHAADPSVSNPKEAVHIVGPAVIAGRKIGGSDPHYPVDARERHVQGTVVLTALIGADGHVHKLEVVASPDHALSEAAREAVQTWTYQPYLLNGVPVNVDTTITVNFRFG